MPPHRPLGRGYNCLMNDQQRPKSDDSPKSLRDTELAEQLKKHLAAASALLAEIEKRRADAKAVQQQSAAPSVPIFNVRDLPDA